MRISDWSSDVCSSDLHALQHHIALIRNRELGARAVQRLRNAPGKRFIVGEAHNQPALALHKTRHIFSPAVTSSTRPIASWPKSSTRSEEHTSELQSLMRISYAVFCLKKKKKPKPTSQESYTHTH